MIIIKFTKFGILAVFFGLFCFVLLCFLLPCLIILSFFLTIESIYVGMLVLYPEIILRKLKCILYPPITFTCKIKFWESRRYDQSHGGLFVILNVNYFYSFKNSNIINCIVLTWAFVYIWNCICLWCWANVQYLEVKQLLLWRLQHLHKEKTCPWLAMHSSCSGLTFQGLLVKDLREQGIK